MAHGTRIPPKTDASPRARTLEKINGALPKPRKVAEGEKPKSPVDKVREQLDSDVFDEGPSTGGVRG